MKLLAALPFLAATVLQIAANGMRYNPKGRGGSGLRIVMREDVVCGGESCTSQSDCCDGAICMTRTTSAGMCVAPVGQPEGGLCLDDESCGAGLRCKTFNAKLGLGLCTRPDHRSLNLSFFQECGRTLDCDTSEELCCRHQSASPGISRTRRICSYFRHPLEECIF